VLFLFPKANSGGGGVHSILVLKKSMATSECCGLYGRLTMVVEGGLTD